MADNTGNSQPNTQGQAAAQAEQRSTETTQQSGGQSGNGAVQTYPSQTASNQNGGSQVPVNRSQGQQTPPNSSGQLQNQQGQQQLLPRRESGGLTRSSHPMAHMRQMMDDMDRLSEAFGFPLMRRMGFPSFYDLAPRSMNDWQQSQQNLWSPQVEVFEKDGNLVVHADLPGMDKEDVNIEIEDDVLTLRGERKSQNEDRKEGYYRSERSYGSFQRSFRLPEGTNAEQIQANFRNGVLEITMPKPQPQQPKSHRIEIK